MDMEDAATRGVVIGLIILTFVFALGICGATLLPSSPWLRDVVLLGTHEVGP